MRAGQGRGGAEPSASVPHAAGSGGANVPQQAATQVCFSEPQRPTCTFRRSASAAAACAPSMSPCSPSICGEDQIAAHGQHWLVTNGALLSQHAWVGRTRGRQGTS